MFARPRPPRKIRSERKSIVKRHKVFILFSYLNSFVCSARSAALWLLWSSTEREPGKLFPLNNWTFLRCSCFHFWLFLFIVKVHRAWRLGQSEAFSWSDQQKTFKCGSVRRNFTFGSETLWRFQWQPLKFSGNCWTRWNLKRYNSSRINSCKSSRQSAYSTRGMTRRLCHLEVGGGIKVLHKIVCEVVWRGVCLPNARIQRVMRALSPNSNQIYKNPSKSYFDFRSITASSPVSYHHTPAVSHLASCSVWENFFFPQLLKCFYFCKQRASAKKSLKLFKRFLHLFSSHPPDFTEHWVRESKSEQERRSTTW